LADRICRTVPPVFLLWSRAAEAGRTKWTTHSDEQDATMNHDNAATNGTIARVARSALAVMAWTVAGIWLATDASAQLFEDDGTQMAFSEPGGPQNVNVHICKGNALLVGVDAANNRFLCSTVPEPLGQLTADYGTGTHMTVQFPTTGPLISVHTCPTLSSMVGLSISHNWLICTQPLPPSGWGARDAAFGVVVPDGPPNAAQTPEPNYPNRNMHACPNTSTQSLFGIKADDNIFLCTDFVVNSCKTSPQLPYCS
jgi:hypothetical protein